MSHTSCRVNPHSIVCVSVKELIAQSMCHIWNLRDSNTIRIHNHLVGKRTLSHLAKLASLAKCWVSVYELTGCGFESRSCQLDFVIKVIYKQLAQCISLLSWNTSSKYRNGFFMAFQWCGLFSRHTKQLRYIIETSQRINASSLGFTHVTDQLMQNDK